jgi:hypothetical protein
MNDQAAFWDERYKGEDFAFRKPITSAPVCARSCQGTAKAAMAFGLLSRD